MYHSLSISLPSGSSLKLSLKKVFEDLKIKREAEQKKPRNDSTTNGSLAPGWSVAAEESGTAVIPSWCLLAAIRSVTMAMFNWLSYSCS